MTGATVTQPPAADAADREAPPVVAPPPGHRRFPYYDSLRGIAAVMVVLIHTLLGAEAMGVPFSAIVNHFEVSITILFMLSAFLLYRPFVAARMGKAPDVAIKDYALRRVLRIVPGYYAALIVLSIYPGLDGVFTSKWWVYFGLLQNYHPLYDPTIAICGQPPYPCGVNSPWSVLEFTGGITPAWTLVVEVSFYAVLPLFVVLMGWLSTRLRRPVRFELVMLALLGLGSVLARLYAYEHFATAVWMLKTLLTIFLWLAAGMALAVVSANLQGREERYRTVGVITRKPWIPWTAAFALYAALVVVLIPTPDSYGQTVAGSIFKFVIETVITVLLLLPATFGDDAGGWPRRVLGNRFISWLGLIAFGLYLYHLPIMFKLLDLGIGDIQGAFLRWMVLTTTTLAISIACGAASYYLIERWFLRLKYRRVSRRRATRPNSALL